MAEQEPSINDALSAAAKKTRLSVVASDDVPTGTAILAAIGGVRGLAESIVPSFAFLILFLLTQNVMLSALVPVGVALIFIVIRAATKVPLSPAITGAVGVGITAALAVITQRGENNFVLGIGINIAFFVAMAVSLIARRPLIGTFVALLLGERAQNWRREPRRYRVLTLATWFWVALFGIRLLVELPLYLTAIAAAADSPTAIAATSALGIAKLILGVPFYALVLWLTWLLVRSVFPPEAVESEGAPPKVS